MINTSQQNANSQPPALMTQAEYARHRDVDRSYVNRLVKRGILVMRGKLVDVAASDMVMDDRPVVDEPEEVPGGMPRPIGEAASTQQPGNFAQARTAEMVYRAKLRKLEFEIKTGKYLLADEVTVRWFTISRTIRDKALGLPSKLAPQLAAMSDLKEIRGFLETEMTILLKSVQEEIRRECA